MNAKRIPYILLAIGGIGIGLYPILYFVIDQKFGLLNSKTDALLADALWNGMFYTHIGLGGLALLVGWIQFNKKIQLVLPCLIKPPRPRCNRLGYADDEFLVQKRLA